MAETLRDLGVVVDHPAPGVYEVAAGDVDWLFVPLEAAAKMRASFILLGPLLSRFGRVIISNPGGDRIGRRPVNLHVDAMRALGAEIEYRNGYYFAKAPGRLRGGEVTFPFVSVMGTENAMLAATLAEGRTTIRPAAQEPEVDDLIAFLQKMGAAVERTAPDTIVVEGRRRLRGADHARRSPTGSRPARSSSRPRWPAGRSPWRARRASTSARSSRRVGRMGVPGRLRPRHDRGRGPAAGRGRVPRRATSRRRPTRASPRTSSRRRASSSPAARARAASTRRSSRTAWSGWPSCAGWAPRWRSSDAHHADDHGPGPAPRRGGRRSATCGPARRSSWPPWRPTGRRTIHGAHHVQRGYENIDRKFHDLGARIERLPEQVRSHSPHEDRHRPRHGQRPRLRQGPGHRHPGAVRRRGRATTTGSSPWARRPAR